MAPSLTLADPHQRFRCYSQLAVFGLIVASLVAVGWYWGPFLYHVLTDHERLKAWITSYGTYAMAVFVAVQFVQVLIFFIPGEVTQFAGGYLFGTWYGLLLSYLGITLGSVTAFSIARFFEHAAVDLLVDRQTLRRFNRFVYGKSGFWPMFILFLIPGIPKDLLCYVAGLTPMHVVTFVIISTVGRFPGVMLSSLFGMGVAAHDWKSLSAFIGVTFVLLGLVYLMRNPIERFREKHLVTTEEKDLEGLS